MPCVVALSAQLDGPAPPAWDHLHAMVSTWLEGGEDERLHRSNLKPWRLGLFDWDPSGRVIIRIGLLDDTLLPHLARIARRVAPEIRLGRQRGFLVTVPGGEPLATVVSESWTDLLDASSPSDRFRFVFRSPTVFRSGQQFVPRPLPGPIFGHLRKRWEAFAPSRLQPDVDFSRCGLVVTRFEGGTLVQQVRGKAVPGFVGEVVVQATSGGDRDRRVLDALARLTPFSGIGYNTPIGMGDATYLPAPGGG